MNDRVSTTRILDKLAEITRLQNRGLMEQSLVQTLIEMVGANEYRLYRVVTPPPEIDLLRVACIQSGVANTSNSTDSHKISEVLTEGIVDSVNSGEITVVEDRGRNLSRVIYPIFDKQDEIYVVLVQFTEKPHFEDQQLIYGLLQVYANYLLLLDDSQKDTLTGLWNRETLNEKVLDILMKKSRQKQRENNLQVRRVSDEVSSWLAVIDIDHFKHVNDEFGHLFGDEVLILFSRFMQDIFREEDLLFRYGGEEFVVIVNVFSEEDAITIYERLRTRMEMYDFPRIDHITISAGLVELSNQEGVKEAIEDADSALYYAKSHGRNRTCIYEELLAAGEIEPRKEIRTGDIDIF